MTVIDYTVFLIPLAFGVMVVHSLIPDCDRSVRFPWFMLILGLGWGLGCGLWSCLSYMTLRSNILSNHIFIVEISIIVMTSTYFVYVLNRGRSGKPNGLSETDRRDFSGLETAMSAIFILSLLIGSCLQLIQSVNNPYGQWDAWSFWNLRAGFIFAHFPDWLIAFDTNASNSNLDYPLLIPSLIFRMWTFVGSNSVVVPIGIGLLFTVSCVLVLVGGVWILNDKGTALIAGICLITAKMFMVCGADQYSDVPLAFYFLSAIVLISVGTLYSLNNFSYLVMAGIMLGLASWTKNEGIMMAPVALLSGFICLVVSHRKLSIYQACFILIGFLPVFWVVADFKMNVAPHDNAFITTGNLPRIWQQIFQFDRYVIIAKRFMLELFAFHRWGFVSLFLIFYAVFKGFRNEASLRPFSCLTLSAISLTLAGYFAIYVITGQDLIVHLDTSLNRLIVHVFPAVLFLFFVNARGLHHD